MDKKDQIRLVKGWLWSGLTEQQCMERCLQDGLSKRYSLTLIQDAKEDLEKNGR